MTATIILAVLLVIAAVVLGSERRTAAAGRALDRVWRPTLRLLRRQPSDQALADRLVAQRNESIQLMGGIWKKSLAAGVLVTVTRVALFVMCIRFVGVPESAASWVAVFCVWAIVRGLTVVPIMPGGVGVSELAYVGLLTPIAGTQYVNEITAGRPAVPDPHLAADDPRRRRRDRPLEGRSPSTRARRSGAVRPTTLHA